MTPEQEIRAKALEIVINFVSHKNANCNILQAANVYAKYIETGEIIPEDTPK
ncbi:MAG: hypothetical protein PHT77_05545 [Bacteroidales bacterium]|nr:hypothetical protein [Bacteroidales bacterium]